MKNIKKYLPFVFTLVLGITLMSFINVIQQEDTIVGKWEEESGVRVIEIYESENKYFGKIVSNKHQDEDQLKPGMVMMDDFVYDEKEKIWEGKVFIPSRDMLLNAKIILENPNQIKSIARIAVISKSKIWNRIN